MISPAVTRRVLEVLRVDIEEGRVYWQIAPRTHPRLLGLEAGSFRATRLGKKYNHVKINGRPIKRGHIIFLAMFGRWPHPALDHKNGDSTDDRGVNIREATATQNAWNHKKRKKKSTTPMGVRTTENGKYVARIGYRCRSIYLGVFSSASAAARIYQAKRKELYGDFA